MRSHECVRSTLGIDDGRRSGRNSAVLLFGFQGEQILAQPLVIALLAVPILIQVYFNSGLAYVLNRISGEQHCVAVRPR